MEGKKRRPIGYWMESRTEDGNSERNENSAADESQTNASEQAARDHFEMVIGSVRPRRLSTTGSA